MRTIKQLLEVMLEHQELFESGLCAWSMYLYYTNIITVDERIILLEYIRKNKPSKYSSWSAYKEQTNSCRIGYYWEHRDIKPRIKWVKQHIKRNS
jgi:hypothetical protein